MFTVATSWAFLVDVTPPVVGHVFDGPVKRTMTLTTPEVMILYKHIGRDFTINIRVLKSISSLLGLAKCAMMCW